MFQNKSAKASIQSYLPPFYENNALSAITPSPLTLEFSSFFKSPFFFHSIHGHKNYSSRS